MRKVKFVYYKLKGDDVRIVRPKKKGRFISQKQVEDIKKQLIKKNGLSNLVYFRTAK